MYLDIVIKGKMKAVIKPNNKKDLFDSKNVSRFNSSL